MARRRRAWRRRVATPSSAASNSSAEPDNESGVRGQGSSVPLPLPRPGNGGGPTSGTAPAPWSRPAACRRRRQAGFTGSSTATSERFGTWRASRPRDREPTTPRRGQRRPGPRSKNGRSRTQDELIECERADAEIASSTSASHGATARAKAFGSSKSRSTELIVARTPRRTPADVAWANAVIMTGGRVTLRGGAEIGGGAMATLQTPVVQILFWLVAAAAMVGSSVRA